MSVLYRDVSQGVGEHWTVEANVIASSFVKQDLFVIDRQFSRCSANLKLRECLLSLVTISWFSLTSTLFCHCVFADSPLRDALVNESAEPKSASAVPSNIDWEDLLGMLDEESAPPSDSVGSLLRKNPFILASTREDEEIAEKESLQRDPPQRDERSDEEMGNEDEDEHEGGRLSDRPVVIPPSASDGRSVDYFVSVALSRHPEILAAHSRVAAAVNVIPQVKALPDPTFSNTFLPFQDHALQTAAGRVAHQMSLNQRIPFPDKLRAKASIASREVQIARAEADRVAREIKESVRLAYYEVWYATRTIAILKENKELVGDLIKVAEARFRSGGSQQDILRAQLEMDRLDERLIQLREQKSVAQADLASLLQEPVDGMPETNEELGLTEIPQQIKALIAMAEQCNPTLRGLALEIHRDHDKQRLACLQQYPDFNVGLNLGIVSDGRSVLSSVADGHDFVSFTLGTTLPIWRDKINAGIREASHRMHRSKRRLQAQRDTLHGKIRRLLVQSNSLVEQRNLYEDRIIPRTEETLKLAMVDYRGKRIDFLTLIETYRELLMFETQLARIDATLAGKIAQLDRTIGCP